MRYGRPGIRVGLAAGCIRRARVPPVFDWSMSRRPPGINSATTAAPTAASTARNSRCGLRVSGLRRRRLAGHLLVNGMDWPGHKRERTTLKLYRNNRNGTFSDVTRSAGSTSKCTAWASRSAITTTTAFPIILVTCVGQNRLFRNTGKGTSSTSPKPADWAAGRHSARRRYGSISIATVCSICSSATM